MEIINYKEQLQRVAGHVALFYLEHSDGRLVYHSATHALEMLEAVKKMASHYKLAEPACFIINAAAWFHDTGYHIPGAEAPERKSCDMAGNFLQTISVNDTDIEAIKNCILASRVPQHPVSLPEKILCDAVLFYLGTDEFNEKDKLLKKELENVSNRKISGGEWRSQTIALLEAHPFHTDYCETFLHKTKAQNFDNQKQKQEEKSLTAIVVEEPAGLEKFTDELPLIQEKKSKKHPDLQGEDSVENGKDVKNGKQDRGGKKGIQTMFRISSTNHQRMSALADNKANIMISVNTIIISVIISLIIPRFETNSRLIIPTIILLVVSIAAIIYSILATRPKLQKGIFTREQIEKKSVNLLFFGSFYKMSFKDYQYGMQEVMNDNDFMYSCLIKDVYWQGRVMGRKFRLLRAAYDIFMYGLVVSVAAYAVAAIFIK